MACRATTESVTEKKRKIFTKLFYKSVYNTHWKDILLGYAWKFTSTKIFFKDFASTLRKHKVSLLYCQFYKVVSVNPLVDLLNMDSSLLSEYDEKY